MKLSALPSVETVLIGLRAAFPDAPHALLKAAAQRAIGQGRASAAGGGAVSSENIAAAASEYIEDLRQPSLRSVINATGVVLHTNLGRAPLGGYSNLEYDLEAGRRGKRDNHIGPLVEQLLGVQAIAVNNNAAAVFLVLQELAAGGEAIVSRGELIEIGDGFRIPDIMRRAGVDLVEVGTTNRTRIADYREALTDRTRLIMRVHPSNFHISGFTARPTLAELAALGREAGVPVYEDVGSGCFVDMREFGINEPLVGESLAAGVGLVSFSGDKLLGGPQAGIIAGDAQLVKRIRANPLFRAMRLDKLAVGALEYTLRALVWERYDDIPTLRMIRISPADLRARAERLLALLPAGFGEIVDGRSLAGGGSTPDQTLPAVLIRVLAGPAHKVERRLRRSEPPVIARVEDDCVVLDLRTVLPEEEDALLSALQVLA